MTIRRFERQKNCNSRATSHREAAGVDLNSCALRARGPSRHDTHRFAHRMRAKLQEWVCMNTASKLGKRKSPDPRRRCALAMLDTRRPCDKFARGRKKRNFERLRVPPHLLRRARARAPAASFPPQSDAPGEAGALPMGGRMAALRGASSGSVPLVWAPLGSSLASLVTRRVLATRSDEDVHPPFGTCGMRIAAPSHEAPACSGRREPIEEVA